jgi:hypothetical protein
LTLLHFTDPLKPSSNQPSSSEIFSLIDLNILTIN